MPLDEVGRITEKDAALAVEISSNLSMALEFEQQDLYDAIMEFLDEEGVKGGKAIAGLLKALAILVAEQAREADPYDPEKYRDHERFTGTPYDGYVRESGRQAEHETEFGLEG